MVSRTHWLIKQISSLLVLAFSFQQIAYAAPDFKPVQIDLFQKPKVHFSFPASVATVEDAWQAPFHSLTVILIQDAHTNESGQINLAKALDIILKQTEKDRGSRIEDRERSVNLQSSIFNPSPFYVFVEAGLGNDSLSFLRNYSSLEERRSVAMSYLRQGLLHGEEYLDLTSTHNFTLWGVEDLPLYRKALEAYRYTASQRDKFSTYLDKIETTLKVLKPRIYNPWLLEFDREYRRFQKEEISLTDFFQVLSKEAKKQAIPLQNFPHLRNLKELKNREAKIDFKKANEEQIKAIASLPEADQKELLELSRKQQSPFKFSTQAHEDGRGFYAFLEENLKDEILPLRYAQGQDDVLVTYPELHKYFRYLKAARKINPEMVLKEEKALEDLVFHALARTDDEASLLKSDRMLRSLRKLFNLTMTPEEFESYKKESADFDIVRLTGFLNRKIMDLKDFYESALFLEKGFDEIVKNAETFYAITTDRDKAFIENMMKKLSEEALSFRAKREISSSRVMRSLDADAPRDDKQVAVLITGGYHTPNLKSILKQRNISYISVRPQVFHETNQKRYEAGLLSQHLSSMPAFARTHAATLDLLHAVERPAKEVLSPLAEALGAGPALALIAQNENFISGGEFSGAGRSGTQGGWPIIETPSVPGTTAVGADERGARLAEPSKAAGNAEAKTEKSFWRQIQIALDSPMGGIVILAFGLAAAAYLGVQVGFHQLGHDENIPWIYSISGPALAFVLPVAVGLAIRFADRHKRLTGVSRADQDHLVELVQRFQTVFPEQAESFLDADGRVIETRLRDALARALIEAGVNPNRGFSVTKRVFFGLFSVPVNRALGRIYDDGNVVVVPEGVSATLDIPYVDTWEQVVEIYKAEFANAKAALGARAATREEERFKRARAINRHRQDKKAAPAKPKAVVRVREDLAKVDLVSVNTLLPEIRDGGKVPDGVLTTRVRNGKRFDRHPRTGARLAKVLDDARNQILAVEVLIENIHLMPKPLSSAYWNKLSRHQVSLIEDDIHGLRRRVKDIKSILDEFQGIIKASAKPLLPSRGLFKLADELDALRSSIRQLGGTFKEMPSLFGWVFWSLIDALRGGPSHYFKGHYVEAPGYEQLDNLDMPLYELAERLRRSVSDISVGGWVEQVSSAAVSRSGLDAVAVSGVYKALLELASENPTVTIDLTLLLSGVTHGFRVEIGRSSEREVTALLIQAAQQPTVGNPHMVAVDVRQEGPEGDLDEDLLHDIKSRAVRILSSAGARLAEGFQPIALPKNLAPVLAGVGLVPTEAEAIRLVGTGDAEQIFNDTAVIWGASSTQSGALAQLPFIYNVDKKTKDYSDGTAVYFIHETTVAFVREYTDEAVALESNEGKRDADESDVFMFIPDGRVYYSGLLTDTKNDDYKTRGYRDFSARMEVGGKLQWILTEEGRKAYFAELANLASLGVKVEKEKVDALERTVGVTKEEFARKLAAVEKKTGEKLELPVDITQWTLEQGIEAATDSSSFAVMSDYTPNDVLIDDLSRVWGWATHTPNPLERNFPLFFDEADAENTSVEAAFRRKFWAQSGLFASQSDSEAMFAKFMSRQTLFTLGPRPAGEEKAGVENEVDKHKHGYIIRQAVALEKKYTGFKLAIQGDGNFLPGLISVLGIDLEGRELNTVGRFGSTEGKSLAQAAANISGGQFIHTDVSAKKTNQRFTPTQAHGYTDEELAGYSRFGTPADYYNRINGRAELDLIKGRGVDVVASVTGVSRQLYGDKFARLFHRPLFVHGTDGSAEIIVNTLIVTRDGSAFIVRTTYKTANLAGTLNSLRQANEPARKFFGEVLPAKSVKSSEGARLSTELSHEELDRSFYVNWENYSPAGVDKNGITWTVYNIPIINGYEDVLFFKIVDRARGGDFRKEANVSLDNPAYFGYFMPQLLAVIKPQEKLSIVGLIFNHPAENGENRLSRHVVGFVDDPELFKGFLSVAPGKETIHPEVLRYPAEVKISKNLVVISKRAGARLATWEAVKSYLEQGRNIDSWWLKIVESGMVLLTGENAVNWNVTSDTEKIRLAGLVFAAQDEFQRKAFNWPTGARAAVSQPDSFDSVKGSALIRTVETLVSGIREAHRDGDTSFPIRVHFSNGETTELFSSTDGSDFGVAVVEALRNRGEFHNSRSYGVSNAASVPESKIIHVYAEGPMWISVDLSDKDLEEALSAVRGELRRYFRFIPGSNLTGKWGYVLGYQSSGLAQGRLSVVGSIEIGPGVDLPTAIAKQLASILPGGVNFKLADIQIDVKDRFLSVTVHGPATETMVGVNGRIKEARGGEAALGARLAASFPGQGEQVVNDRAVIERVADEIVGLAGQYLRFSEAQEGSFRKLLGDYFRGKLSVEKAVLEVRRRKIIYNNYNVPFFKNLLATAWVAAKFRLFSEEIDSVMGYLTLIQGRNNLPDKLAILESTTPQLSMSQAMDVLTQAYALATGARAAAEETRRTRDEGLGTRSLKEAPLGARLATKPGESSRPSAARLAALQALQAWFEKRENQYKPFTAVGLARELNLDLTETEQLLQQAFRERNSRLYITADSTGAPHYLYNPIGIAVQVRPGDEPSDYPFLGAGVINHSETREYLGVTVEAARKQADKFLSVGRRVTFPYGDFPETYTDKAGQTSNYLDSHLRFFPATLQAIEREARRWNEGTPQRALFESLANKARAVQESGLDQLKDKYGAFFEALAIEAQAQKKEIALEDLEQFARDQIIRKLSTIEEIQLQLHSLLSGINPDYVRYGQLELPMEPVEAIKSVPISKELARFLYEFIYRTMSEETGIPVEELEQIIYGGGMSIKNMAAFGRFSKGGFIGRAAAEATPVQGEVDSTSTLAALAQRLHLEEGYPVLTLLFNAKRTESRNNQRFPDHLDAYDAAGIDFANVRIVHVLPADSVNAALVALRDREKGRDLFRPITPEELPFFVGVEGANGIATQGLGAYTSHAAAENLKELGVFAVIFSEKQTRTTYFATQVKNLLKQGITPLVPENVKPSINLLLGEELAGRVRTYTSFTGFDKVKVKIKLRSVGSIAANYAVITLTEEEQAELLKSYSSEELKAHGIVVLTRLQNVREVRLLGQGARAAERGILASVKNTAELLVPHESGRVRIKEAITVLEVLGILYGFAEADLEGVRQNARRLVQVVGAKPSLNEEYAKIDAAHEQSVKAVLTQYDETLKRLRSETLNFTLADTINGEIRSLREATRRQAVEIAKAAGVKPEAVADTADAKEVEAVLIALAGARLAEVDLEILKSATRPVNEGPAHLAFATLPADATGFLSRVGVFLAVGSDVRLALAKGSNEVSVYDLRKEPNKLLVVQGKRQYILNVSTGVISRARQDESREKASHNNGLTKGFQQILSENSVGLSNARTAIPIVVLVHLYSFEPKAELPNLLFHQDKRLSEGSVVILLGNPTQIDQAMMFVNKNLRNRSRFIRKGAIPKELEKAPHILLMKERFVGKIEETIPYHNLTKFVLQDNTHEKAGVIAYGRVVAIANLIGQGFVKEAFDLFVLSFPLDQRKEVLAEGLEGFKKRLASERGLLFPVTIWASFEEARQLYMLARVIGFSA